VTHVRPDPAALAGVVLVIVDGDNLLHRLRGMRDDAGIRWLLPRLKAWRPEGVELVVVLDGYPEPGAAFRRPMGSGFEIRHSGSVDADSSILAILQARPYADRKRTVVVTDDRSLADRVRHAGGVPHRLGWLMAQLRAAGDSHAARPMPLGARPARASVTSDTPDRERDPERRPWSPGRGATRKRGNPRKGAR
jgi:hypothetical protein